eukprot:scaffold76541_cov42-Phaeocystis_antarctica.AAC.1
MQLDRAHSGVGCGVATRRAPSPTSWQVGRRRVVRGGGGDGGGLAGGKLRRLVEVAGLVLWEVEQHTKIAEREEVEQHEDGGQGGLQQRQHRSDHRHAAAPQSGAEHQATRQPNGAHVAASGLRVLLSLVVDVQEEEEEKEADKQVGVRRVDDKERRDSREQQLSDEDERCEAHVVRDLGGTLAAALEEDHHRVDDREDDDAHEDEADVLAVPAELRREAVHRRDVAFRGVVAAQHREHLHHDGEVQQRDGLEGQDEAQPDAHAHHHAQQQQEREPHESKGHCDGAERKRQQRERRKQRGAHAARLPRGVAQTAVAVREAAPPPAAAAACIGEDEQHRQVGGVAHRVVDRPRLPPTQRGEAAHE